MGVAVSSRNEDDRLFLGWSGGVRVLAEGLEPPRAYYASHEWWWDSYMRAWRDALERPRVVVSWYRRSSVGSHEMGPVVWAVVARCLGHRLDRRLVCGHPRVAALCAALFFKGRWRAAEDSIGRDVVACYFYASALGGRLPDHLHNRVILEWSGEYAARRYLGEFCGVAQNLG